MDRTQRALLRLASALPKGSEERRSVLALARWASRTVDLTTVRLEVSIKDLGGRLIVDAWLREEARNWLDKATDPKNAEPVVQATYDYNTEAGTVYLNRMDAWKKGKGYAPELLEAILTYFAGRGFSDAEGYVENDNSASQRMLKKLNFSLRRQQEHGAYWGRKI